MYLHCCVKLIKITRKCYLFLRVVLNLDRKRTGPPVAVPIPSKKPKSQASSSHKSFAWEQMCIEVDTIDLIDSLSYAFNNQENLKAVSL